MIKIFSSLEEASKAIPLGSIKLLILDGKKMALAHTKEGFHAFENECPHQYEPLHKGRITSGNEVTCRLHEYRFNLITGKEADSRCDSMNIYSIIVKDSGVFIQL
ncbi:MAG: Rieske (2Fe-2S) protein [Bacteroidetes bacterium]|nr:MAG: Rieske (2Fe-2S) protein [Bacteroidota bacterium]